MTLLIIYICSVCIFLYFFLTVFYTNKYYINKINCKTDNVHCDSTSCAHTTTMSTFCFHALHQANKMMGMFCKLIL